MRHIFSGLLTTIALSFACGFTPVHAEETPQAPPPVVQVVPSARQNPRATMETFLTAMSDAHGGASARIEDAEACLDLSDLSEIVRAEKGRELAATLSEVIDRVAFVQLESIPNAPDGPLYVFTKLRAGDIAIGRVESGEWLFTRSTVEALPEMFKEVRKRKVAAELVGTPREALSPAVMLRQHIPDRLQERGFLLEHWQWIGLALLIVLGVVLDRVVSFVIAGFAKQLARRHQAQMEEALGFKVWRPMGFLAATGLWWVGIDWLSLPGWALEFLRPVVVFAAAAAGVWTMYNLVDVFAAYLTRRAEHTDTKLDDLLIPLVRRSLKIFIVAFGVIFIADNLNINITSLLAGIGLGGLAFALAAKDTVENLFGSLTVILDQPFHVGDWVVIGDIEGTVDSVGFRSTRIRTFYNSLITVPNSRLINAAVDNFGARSYRRIKTYLSLTYDTPPEKIDAFCEGIRELLRQHPYTRKDYFQVYLNQFGAHSLDVLLYCFHQTPDWNTELRERHRLFLDILRLAERLKVEFAFPTQTMLMHEQGHWETPANSLRDETAASKHGRELGRELAKAQWDGRDVPPPVTFQIDSIDDSESEQRTAGS